MSLHVNNYPSINGSTAYTRFCIHTFFRLLIATHCAMSFMIKRTQLSAYQNNALCQHIPFCPRCPWLHAATRWLEYRTPARIVPGCRGRYTPKDRVLVAPRWDELVGSSGTRIPDAVPLDSPRHIYSETYNTITSFHDCRNMGSGKSCSSSVQRISMLPSRAGIAQSV